MIFFPEDFHDATSQHKTVKGQKREVSFSLHQVYDKKSAFKPPRTHEQAPGLNAGRGRVEEAVRFWEGIEPQQSAKSSLENPPLPPFPSS